MTTPETTAAKEIEALRARGVFVTHDEWWDQVGSALKPRVGEDAHEHVKRVTAICWMTARAAIYEVEAAQLMQPLRAQVAYLRERKDGAYLERNQVVAALSKCFPSGIAKTAIEGWSEDWHGCVYIDLPTGQVSWHFHDSQAHLFAHLPPYAGVWDGHDTSEKYRRLACLQTTGAQVEQYRKLLADDAYAITFQTLSQYRTALLAAIDKARKA